MSPERQNLLNLAITVGLVIGVDFEKNISNINLQKKIEEKQEELANGLKGVEGEDKDDIDAKFADIENWIASPTTEQLENIAVGLFKRTNVSIDDIKYFFLKQGVEQEQIDSINFNNVVEQAAKESLGIPSELLGNEKEGASATTIDFDGGSFFTGSIDAALLEPYTIKNEKKIEDDEEDNALILRKTECFTYRTEIIGFKETARRSNVTVEEIKEAIESGLPVGGYIFEFVG